MVKHRTEVIAGEGLTFRHGDLSAWIGPGASPALVTYLVGYARDLSSNPFPGPELANRLEGVLRGVDPEPATPFLVVGAAPGGLEALLHGPVQMWDATQWVVLPAGTGWMRWTFAGEGPVVAGPAGSLPPQLMVDSPIDLTTGVVPGGGLALLPLAPADDPVAAQAAQGQGDQGSGSNSAMAAEATMGVASGVSAGPGGSESSPAPAAPDGGMQASGLSGTAMPGGALPGGGGGMPGGGLSGRPSAATIIVPPPGSPAAPVAPVAPVDPVAPVAPQPATPERAERPAAPVGPTPGAEAPRPPGGLREKELGDQAGADPIDGSASVNLREPYAEHRAPLPLASAPVEELAGGVQVQGIRCSRGHFNHPRALYCTACGIATTHQTHVVVRGPRPPLGVLVIDDGSTFSLDSGYVIGSAPESDEAVVRGEERPLRLPVPEDQVSPIHAEIRLVDWDVQVIDRGSASGTFILPPGAQQWQPVQPGSAVVLMPNSHVACGRRVFAFESHLRN